MTAIKSETNASKPMSYTKEYFKFRLRENKKFFIFLCVTQLLGLPLIVLSLIAEDQREQMESYTSRSSGAYVIIGTLMLVLGLVLGWTMAVNCFRYLNRKTEVDMIHSLPVSTDKRFFADFFAGLLQYTAPFIVSTLLSGAMLFIYSFLIADETIWNDITTSEFCKILFMLFMVFLGVLMSAVMLYTITVLVVCCCGSILESIIYTLFLNACIPLAIYAYAVNNIMGRYGVDSDGAISAISISSPIGGIIKCIETFDGEELEAGYYSWLLIFTLITVALFITAFVLNKKRKAEQVSTPCVFKGIYYILIVTILFCIGSVFFNTGNDYDSDLLVPFIIVSAVVFSIFEVVRKRGFKKPLKSLLLYGVSMAVVSGFMFAAYATEGFGVVYKIPSKISVSSVNVGVRISSSDGDRRMNDTYKFKSDEALAIIRQIHELALAEYDEALASGIEKDYKSTYYGGIYYSKSAPCGEIDLSYNLKNGFNVCRQYDISQHFYPLVETLFLTDEINEIVCDKMKKSIDEETNFNWRATNIFSNGSTLSFDDKDEMRAFTNELAEAYEKDLTNTKTAENLYKYNCIGYLGTVNDPNRYSVYEEYTNTLAVLEKYDKAIPEMNGINRGSDLRFIKINKFTSDLEDDEKLFRDENFYEKAQKMNPSAFSYIYTSEIDDSNIDEIVEIVSNSKQWMVLEKNDSTYLVEYQDKYYAVPDEYINDIETLVQPYDGKTTEQFDYLTE